MEATSSSASHSQAASTQDRRLDHEPLIKARILPFIAVPQIPPGHATATQPSPGVLQESLIETLSPEEIRNYFQSGGDICPRDEQYNNPAHLLAIHHGTLQNSPRADEHERLERLEQTASTLMSFYTPLEATEICMERNSSGLTPWHPLLDQSTTEGLTAGAHVIARNFLKAAASPLNAGKVLEVEECPALALLSRLGDYNEPNEILLSLITNTDPTLVIDYDQGSHPAVVEHYPTLLIAAIDLRRPNALRLMLKAGAEFPKQHHPAQAALDSIGEWPDDVALRQCVDTLCEWAVTIGNDSGEAVVLPDCLPNILSRWQQQLEAEPADYQDGIIKSVRLLFDLIEDHNTPFSLNAQPHQENFQRWFQHHVPRLWQRYRQSLRD